MDLDLQTSIELLGLSNRTTNALKRNNVLCLKDLVVLSNMDLLMMRGLGVNSVVEINEFLAEYGGVSEKKKCEQYSFGDYWRKAQSDDRNLEVLVSYYNGGNDITLQDVGEKYGVTRERIRQLIKKGTERIYKAYINGLIDKDIVDRIEEYANKRTEIHLVNTSDSYFSCVGISYLMTAIAPKKYKIYKSAKINGQWFVKNGDNVNSIINILYDELRYRPEPLAISDVEKIYSISEDMLLSIKDVIEKDGYVTLKSNKRAAGTDKNTIVEEFIESLNRPASVSEIAIGTGFSESQVRGVISKKNEFKNVGRSIYDLDYQRYDDATIDELVEKIMIAEDRALTIDNIYDSICNYRNISKEELAYELIESSRTYRSGDYYLLNGWDESKIETNVRNVYDLQLRDVVFEIINETDEVYDCDKVSERIKKYGDAVSQNTHSIKMTLATLARDGMIRRVGTKTSGCYVRIDGMQVSKPNDDEQVKNKNDVSFMKKLSSFVNAHIGSFIEIRYKTDRVKSDKRWRVINVRGQDAIYLYTNDLNNYGYRVKYCKDKIVDYREHYSQLEYDIDDEDFMSPDTEINALPLFNDITRQLFVNKEYTNDDIVNIFRVSSQGGMRKSNTTNSLVLIARHRPDNPYDDKWNGDHFEYTGMGMIGDQSVDFAQNKTLTNSRTNGVTVYLFESFKEKSYIYKGIVELDGEPYFERQKDANGNMRRVVKFSLKLAS